MTKYSTEKPILEPGPDEGSGLELPPTYQQSRFDIDDIKGLYGSSVLVGTSNKGKQAELSALLLAAGLRPVTLGSVPDIPETGRSYRANALLKARALSKLYGGVPVLSEDSGLGVMALHGAPGLHSGRYSGSADHNSVDNVEKLLAAMKGERDRRAAFITAAALAYAGKAKAVTRRVPGTITDVPRGDKGFSYDTVFVPEGDTRTYAESGDKQDSSRVRAVRALLEKKAAAGNLGWTGSIDTTPEGTASWIKNDVIKGGSGDRLLYGAGTAATLIGLNLLRRKLNGKKIRLRDWLVPGALGYMAGAGYQIGRDLLRGQDYGRTYDTSKLKDGDTVFIGVSGGGDGPGSELDKAMYDKLGEGNYAMFRHGDTAKLEAFIRSLPAGVKPVVIGHSYGAAALPKLKERLGRDDIEWHSIDPVSWRGKLGGATPAGTMYLPDDANGSIKDTANNFIATVGGRWGDRGYKNTKRYLGGHSRGVEELVRDRIIPGYLQ